MEGITVNGNFIACNPNDVSDGYHTFGELYDHRCLLFIHIINGELYPSFASYTHEDGTIWDGWFIAGCMMLNTELVTYHLPNKYADLVRKDLWIDEAPKWDGHTSQDVIQRLIQQAKMYGRYN